MNTTPTEVERLRKALQAAVDDAAAARRDAAGDIEHLLVPLIGGLRLGPVVTDDDRRETIARLVQAVQVLSPGWTVSDEIRPTASTIFAFFDLNIAHRQDGSTGVGDEPLYAWQVREGGNDTPLGSGIERDLASEDADEWQTLADQVLTDNDWIRVGEWVEAPGDRMCTEVAATARVRPC